ncbi:MAG: hypothetical protein R3B13_13740 [Polyangiaceae bacterium]
MRTAAVALLVSVVSCSSRPAPVVAPEPQPAPAVSAASTPTASEPTTIETPAPPTEIAEPANVACRIAGDAWDQAKLHLRASTPSFGRVQGAPTTLLLPVTDKPEEAIAVMDDGKVLIRAVVLQKELGFFMPRPVALLGMLTVESDMPVRWVSSAPGDLRVGLDASHELLTPYPFQADLGCWDVSLSALQYDARASITKQKKLQRLETARDGVELTAKSGESTATLKAGILVEVLQQKGEGVLVLIDGNGYFLSGWVPRKELVATKQMSGSERGPSMSYGRGMGGIRRTVTCGRDVDLYLEHGSDRMKVGVVHAGARLVPTSESTDAGFVTFDMPSLTWLFLEESAKLSVEKKSLESCQEDSR